MSAGPDPASVSVVVPTFNDLGRIGDALASIVGQSTPPGEIVVSDDASEDDIEGFVHDFAAQQAGGVSVRWDRRARKPVPFSEAERARLTAVIER
ncbi:MAG: glycosyltransferase [Solirubrobacteraceae bacterium]